MGKTRQQTVWCSTVAIFRIGTNKVVISFHAYHHLPYEAFGLLFAKLFLCPLLFHTLKNLILKFGKRFEACGRCKIENIDVRMHESPENEDVV